MQKNLCHSLSLPTHFARPPFQRVSCTQQMSRCLLAAISTISSHLPLILPTFTVPLFLKQASFSFLLQPPAFLPGAQLVLCATWPTVTHLSLQASGEPTNAPLVDPRDGRCGIVYE